MKSTRCGCVRRSWPRRGPGPRRCGQRRPRRAAVRPLRSAVGWRATTVGCPRRRWSRRCHRENWWVTWQRTGAGRGGDVLITQLAKLLCEWVGAMNRRELLQLFGWASSTIATTPVLAGLNPDEHERLIRAVGTPSRVDHKVIDQFAAMLQYCKRQEDTLGSRAVLKTVLTQRDFIEELIPECSSDLRPELLTVYSDMSSSMGFYFLELNDFDNARRFYDRGRAAAEDAGNVELNIYALCEMSYAASWRGKPHSGISHAAAAQSLLGKTGDPFMPVCVATQAARAYATDGQYEMCMKEFDRAEDSLASAGEAPATSPAYWYHAGIIASERSDCLLRLGKPDEAITSANNALRLFDSSFVGSLAFCNLFLGKALLQTKEINEAARVVGDAAGLTAQTRAPRLVRELRTTRTRMEPWANTDAVRALDEQLTDYGLLDTAA